MSDHLKLHMAEIARGITDLESLLLAFPPSYILLHQIPTFYKEDEIIAPQSIDVDVKIGGPELTSELLKALRDFYSYDLTSSNIASTKITNKYPGLVAVDCPKNDLLHVISRINKAKEDFKSELKRVTQNSYDRFTLLHTLFPRVVTLQVTRSIGFFEHDLMSAGFYWHIPTISKHVTKQEMVDYLFSCKRKLDSDVFQSAEEAARFEAMLEDEISILSALSTSAKLRTVRISQIPTPAMNGIFLDSNGKRNQLNRRSALPLFLSSRPKKVTLLKAFESAESDKDRDRKVPYRPLIARIGLELLES